MLFTFKKNGNIKFKNGLDLSMVVIVKFHSFFFKATLKKIHPGNEEMPLYSYQRSSVKHKHFWSGKMKIIMRR